MVGRLCKHVFFVLCSLFFFWLLNNNNNNKQALQEVGTYANYVLVSKAAGGDTGLHIAVTLGCLRAAQVLLFFVEK